MALGFGRRRLCRCVQGESKILLTEREYNIRESYPVLRLHCRSDTADVPMLHESEASGLPSDVLSNPKPPIGRNTNPSGAGSQPKGTLKCKVPHAE